MHIQLCHIQHPGLFRTWGTLKILLNMSDDQAYVDPGIIRTVYSIINVWFSLFLMNDYVLCCSFVVACILQIRLGFLYYLLCLNYLWENWSCESLCEQVSYSLLKLTSFLSFKIVVEISKSSIFKHIQGYWCLFSHTHRRTN